MSIALTKVTIDTIEDGWKMQIEATLSKQVIHKYTHQDI